MTTANMQGMRSFTLALLAVVLFANGRRCEQVFGQPPATELEPVYLTSPGGALFGEPTDPRHIDALVARFGKLRDFALRTYLEVFEFCHVDFARSLTEPIWNSPQLTAVQAKAGRDFLLQIDELVRAYRAALGASKDPAGELTNSNRFQSSSSPERQSDIVYFQGTIQEIVTSTGFERRLTPAQATDLRYRAEALHTLLVELKRVSRADAVASIEAAVTRWSNFLDRGYSQYPWESLVNGKLWSPIRWDKVPRQQLVLLHPELGMEVAIRNDRDAKTDELLLLHVLGYVRYFGADRDYFLGASATAASSDDNGFGFGSTLHLGFPQLTKNFTHLSVGVLWHDIDDDGDYFDQAPFVSLSIDLLSLLQIDEGAVKVLLE
ncbi:MAG: hypothetical protein ACKVX7_09015 [Planctomycetota bacterium]